MDFYFSHDGETFHLKTTDSGEVKCDQLNPRPQQSQQQQPLEPSGDTDE